MAAPLPCKKAAPKQSKRRIFLGSAISSGGEGSEGEGVADKRYKFVALNGCCCCEDDKDIYFYLRSIRASKRTYVGRLVHNCSIYIFKIFIQAFPNLPNRNISIKLNILLKPLATYGAVREDTYFYKFQLGSLLV